MDALITVEGVEKDFGNQVKALDQINLEIASGDIYGIIGMSGAGKSTLVRCLNYLEKPTAGVVKIHGKDLSTLKGRQLRKERQKIAMIFQHFNLLMQKNVLDNICFPLVIAGVSKKQAKKRAVELLQIVGLADKAKAYPGQLSGGQKQRVAIARALANNPDILLCDEATSALDPQTTQSILELLQQINHDYGITIVLITHEMAVVKEICSRVAVMEHGSVVEQGDIFSIFISPKQPVTQDFIRTTSNLQKIEELIAENAPITQLKPGELIVRLSYTERNTSEALISSASRQFEIDINIIFANIESVQGAPIGGTVAIISGARERITAAIAYLIEKNVGVEVLKDARVA